MVLYAIDKQRGTQMVKQSDFINQYGHTILEFQGFSNGGFYFGKDDEYIDVQVTMTPISTSGMEFAPVVTLNDLIKLNASTYVVAKGRPSMMAENKQVFFEGEVSTNMRPPLRVVL